MMIKVQSAGNTTLWIEHEKDGIYKYTIRLFSGVECVSIQHTESLALGEIMLLAGFQIYYRLATDSDAKVVEQFIEDTRQ